MKNRLVKLADGVWLWPHDPDYNAVQACVGVIIGEDETVLIDAGNSPHLVRQIRTDLEERSLPEVGRIIYTHHHWDHVSGACELEAPVTAHVKCRDILAEEARKPWSSAYLDRLVERNPKLRVSCKARDRAIRDWETFRIVVPDTVFDTSTVIDLGHVTIHLEHVGGGHAEDSIVARVPEAGIMFLGDCYYPPPLHLQTPKSRPSHSILASLASDEYDLYVEGHDVPFTRSELSRCLRRIR
jgi:glyoxylase-like metal-dependent hydrolase (beta-lactamase superfamily II)